MNGTATWWCEYAWLGGESAEAGVTVSAEDGVITGVETGVAARPSGARTLTGLSIPGLANAHSHAFQRALRGRTHTGRGDFWSWREEMYAAAGRIDPDNYLALARATYGEMALAGITTVGEFHYLHHGPGGTPYDDPNATGEALIEAAGQAGIRITLIDTCYLHGGIGVEVDPAQRRFADRDAAAWAGRVGDLFGRPSIAGNPLARTGAAIHSVRAVDPDSAAEVAAWADGHGAPLHAHVSEQPAENEACLTEYGLTPTALLAEAGATGERFTAIHATHLAEADFTPLGQGTVCLCPTTERDLADGIGPARRLVEAGARLSTGSDSNALIEPFEEVRAIELDQRLATGVRGSHSPAELLVAATADGQACLGWPEAGRIEAGAPADLVTVGLGGVGLAGTDPARAIASLVFAAGPRDVRNVIVAGETVVKDGAHVSIDVGAELNESIAAVTR